uniref:Uncharacterized protein LOC101505754 n=1 Tax=Cicer arietinum TaxID=3827 RepID=A0A1S2XST8_CICAR|nr:uncharacterized protein LOC101505754 [Cicer arietinum]
MNPTTTTDVVDESKECMGSWLTLSLSQPPISRKKEIKEVDHSQKIINPATTTPDVVDVKEDKLNKWLTLSLSQPLPPSPPRLLPFKYTQSTPPTQLPINLKTFFYSELKEKQQDLSLCRSPPTTTRTTTTTTNKVQGNSIGRPQIQPSHPKTKDKTKSAIITPPYPWATSKRATIHTFRHLIYELKIKTISGTLQCKFCMFLQTHVEYDLAKKFQKVARFIKEKRDEMNERAPNEWMSPMTPKCESCGKERAMKPFITKKRNINWLFLFLGEMIGCCKYEYLQYFCKHTDNHKTDSKDRLLSLMLNNGSSFFLYYLC